MNVIYCSACGMQMDSSASFCSKCGAKICSEPAKCTPPVPPLSPASPIEQKVTILGYTEWFAASPSVSIYSNGVKVGSVARNGRLELKISEPCVLEFKTNLRTTQCFVNPNDVVVLNFDRALGGLHATITDKNNSHNVVSQKKKNDRIKIIIICSIIFGIPLLVLSLLAIVALISLLFI